MTANEERRAAAIRFPQVDRVELRNFSLYDNAPEIEARFPDGVFCLAGANGLGKSTFLSALKYAITGIVAEPDRKFDSPPEYYRKCLPYSANYFRGRISERDADLAEVAIDMRVNGARYELTRGMFDPTGLRRLVITRGDDTEYGSDGTEGAVEDAERHAAYSKSVVRDCGVQSFPQLVFLYHFILTFDERRNLIFWDNTVARTALFMAFGADLEQAERADAVRRTSERADSLARNLQWQATDLRKKLEVLEEASDPERPTDPELSQLHERLQGDHDAAVALLADREAAIRDAQLRVANLRAELSAVNDAYDSEVAVLFEGPRDPRTHPVVVHALEHSHCAICGSTSATVTTAVRGSLDSYACPLCTAPFTRGVDAAEASEELLALDTRRGDLDAEIAEAESAVRRLISEIASARSQAEQLASELAEFERANELATLRDGTRRGLNNAGARYREQIEDLLARKEEQRKKRDVARRELRALEASLTVAFADAEEQFVPLFAGLAHEFLGLQVDVHLELRGPLPLVLTVEAAQRRSENALSESQRFFVDIALRMALAIYMADGGPACLYVDTPEGSLDIAYERRAGSMFAKFVADGHRMVMTANINTSQLLLRLAELCRTEKMLLRRMTEWTSLSDVQAAEEGLFDEAYAAVERAIQGEALK